MSQNGPFLGFTLRDTLTRIIPGLIFLTPLMVGVAVFSSDLIPDGPILYVLLGLSAYLTGEFIDQLRAGLFRVPMTFRYFVYKETGQMEKMPSWYIRIVEFQEKLPKRINFYEEIEEEDRLTNSLDFDFRKDIESELGVDFVENRPREIYDFLLIYMDDYFTPRLRRQQSVAVFSTNIRIAVVGTLVVWTLYAIVNWGNVFIWSVWGISILITLFLMIFWPFLTMTHYQYDELLLKEYYMKRLGDRKA